MRRQLLRNCMIATLMAFCGTTMTMAQESTTTTTVDPSADTYVRMNNTTDHGSANNMELQTYSGGGDTSKATDFVGLMRFEVPEAADGATLQSAVLKLVTKRIKGDKEIAIYAYSNSFDEDAIYTDEADYITAARANDPIATFTVNGQSNKDVTSDALGDDYLTVASWTDSVDITTYIQSNEGQTINLMLEKTADQNNSTQIFTKEAEDITNSKAGISLTGTDLYPCLILTYSVASGINNVKVEEDADAAIYTLQGIRVDNMNQSGVYIRNGKKIVVK